MIVGVDVAKATVVAVVMDKSTKIHASYTIVNTKEQLTEFVGAIQKKYRKVVFASEATAEYHRILALLCIERGIPFRLLNPITTKQFTRSTVRKRKTDLTDAEVIAKLALQKEGTLITKEAFLLTKPAARTAMKLVSLQQILNLMEQRLHFIHMDYSLISSLEKCREEMEKTQKLFQEYAKTSQDKSIAELLQSIPGIGPQTASIIMAEVVSIARFKTAKGLVAFCGLDPKVKQSGGSLHHNTHLTKRGSPYLRKAIFFAASIAQRHDPELMTYYNKKRTEGRQYKEATVAVARKLFYRVYAVWRRGTPYIAKTG